MPAVRQQVAQANLSQVGTVLCSPRSLSACSPLSRTRRVQNKLPLHTFALIILTVVLIDTWRIDKLFLAYAIPIAFPPKSASTQMRLLS